jgi:hypothetical protein
VTLAEKAAAMWAALNESERAGVRVGLFPRAPMEQAEREGWTAKDLSVALMEHAARVPAAPARGKQGPRRKPERTGAVAAAPALAPAAPRAVPSPASPPPASRAPASPAPSSRSPVPSSFARAAAQFAQPAQGPGASSRRIAGAVSSASPYRIVRFLVPLLREARAKLRGRGINLLREQEVYAGAPDHDGLYASRPAWGAVAAEMRDVLRDVPGVRERDVTAEYVFGRTRAPRDYDYPTTFSLDASDAARRLVALPARLVEVQRGRYESGNYRLELLGGPPLSTRAEVIHDMIARVERGELTEDAGVSAIEAHDRVLDQLGTMRDDPRAIAAYKAAIAAGAPKAAPPTAGAASKAPSKAKRTVDTSEVDRGWDDSPPTVTSARTPPVPVETPAQTQVGILDALRAAGFQPNRAAAEALYRDGLTAKSIRHSLDVNRAQFVERWKLLPPPSASELDVLGRRLRTLGAAAYGDVSVRVVPHPSVRGTVDALARAYAAEVTEAGQRSYVSGEPMYLGEAQDAGLRVLRDGTGRNEAMVAEAAAPAQIAAPHAANIAPPTSSAVTPREEPAAKPAVRSAQPPPASTATPLPKGVSDFLLAREDGPNWSVSLSVLVRHQPKEGSSPTPAKGVARPWRVLTVDAGNAKQQAFWDQPDARQVFEREARERWAAITRVARGAAASQPSPPAPPDPATITSIAALRQIAPGTRLRRLDRLPLWDDGLRIVVGVETKPDRLVLRFDDASPKHARHIMTTLLDEATVVPVSEHGGLADSFRIVLRHGLGSEQYRFEDWQGPGSLTPWREAFTRAHEARVGRERVNVARWARQKLDDAQDEIDDAKSPRERARAETRYADVAAAQRVGSFRGVDAARLARLIERAKKDGDDYLEDMLAAQEAGAFGAPSGQVGLFGARAAWDPKHRPLTARFDEAQRHAMLARAPETVEEYLLAAWSNVEAALRGESPEHNYQVGQERLRHAARLLKHQPVGAPRYRDAENEVGNLHEALLGSRPVPVPVVALFGDEAHARKALRDLEQVAKDEWPNNTVKTKRVVNALKAALGGDEARAAELVEHLKRAWGEVDVEQSLDPAQHRVLVDTNAGPLALSHAGDRFTLVEESGSRTLAEGSAMTVALAIAALRASETSEPGAPRDDEAGDADQGDETPEIPVPTKPIVPAARIPAPTKPIVPATGITAPTKAIVPAASIPAPTKPIVPPGARSAGIAAPTKPIVPAGGVLAPTKPIVSATGIPTPTKPRVLASDALAPTQPIVPAAATTGGIAAPPRPIAPAPAPAEAPLTAAPSTTSAKLPSATPPVRNKAIELAPGIRLIPEGLTELNDDETQRRIERGEIDPDDDSFDGTWPINDLTSDEFARRYASGEFEFDEEPLPSTPSPAEGTPPHRAIEAPAAPLESDDETDDEDAPEPGLVERLAPVEHRTAAKRRNANIKAMWLAAELEAHPRPLTVEDRRTLLEYSDWGGVGVEHWADRFPPGFPVPEARQLIHAYFTPPAVCAEIARVLKPMLPALVSTDGKVHALEPAAGIGRFPLALSGPGFEIVAWHCVEYSTVSYKMLRLLRPDIDLFHGPFERWVAERGDSFAGRLKLVVSNPPYADRNLALTEDPDRSYRYDRADVYFLRRGLDLLGAGGIGVYIIPSGFLTGTSAQAKKLREEVLRRHHLMAAFRLPNEVWSLANVVTDILFFRARGAVLDEVDETDRFVLEGRYYDEFPGHILGQVVHNEPGKRGWHTTAEGYTVVGAFAAIPPFEERPMCASCQHLPAPAPAAPPPTAESAEVSPVATIVDQDERMAAAVGLGRRVEAFLASVANPDHEPIGWEELHHDLTEWAAANGPPGKDKDLIALAQAERGPLGRGESGGAGWLLKAFLGKSTTLIPSLAEKPRWAPRFVGDANDPLQVGDYLYRTRKTLSIDDLPGKDPSALFAAGWCEDSLSLAWTERLDVRGQLVPPDEYLFGELWPKFDRADARGRLGDVQAAAQARRLLELIQPATFDEIEITPQDGFVPLDLVGAWLATLNHGEAVNLVRDKGLVRLADVAYEDHGKELLNLSQEALLCLGWINHDYVVFQPYSDGDSKSVDEARLEYAREWTERFRAFCEADPERQRAIEHSYQRARQGYRAHGYGSEPLKLMRWNPAVVLNPHQIAGARRLDANHGGGLGFDVGVGKTFTILAALALARQQGRARRPVIVVPQPIALQWVDNIAKALPDFRVVVIGVSKKTISRGLRKGLETSETDSPEERSRKWARFQGGEFDVAIVTYDSLPRSKMDQASMLRFIEGVTAIEREVEIKRRNAKLQQKQAEESYREKKDKLEHQLERAKNTALYGAGSRQQKAQEKRRKLETQLKELDEKHARRRLTERQEAILAEGVGAWLAEMLELPEGWRHDPDIVWQNLGITWIAFDEAHNGKNLHMPSSREGGSVPKFMGNEGEGSHRAWHWYFRCCDVQSRGGEVILATATPASNSPLEFYNLVKLIDDKAWTRIGIHDPEAFIDRFCLLEPEEVVGVDMQTDTRLACVGFKNLDELRSVVMKLWEFKTAKQAGLKLPKPKIERVFVDMDAAQEQKYQQYVDEIELALANPREGSHKILGLLQRMASVAQHAQLDEKFEWSDAHLVDSPHSPKYDALAKRVLALRGCGHIVFSDYVPAHAWIRDVLIEAGIPAGRIGILNAVVAPSAADRQRTAREFNGSESVPPKYDVLIANTIGEEGVDLQRRACAIHHMDIGWTPKKLDQRNGRGYRQGNTLANIEIIYYIANRSQDGARLDMVRGKQNWISSLLEGEGKEVNNPAAQSTLTRKELLVLISRDPEKTRARLEAAEAEREQERKKKVAAAASGTLRAIANRFDRARTEPSPTVAAEHLSVARQKLAGLTKVDPTIWPWMPWAAEAERYPMLVPKEGGPVYEGLRVAMPRLLDRSVLDFAEFGRIDGSSIGTRVAGAAHWDETSVDKVVQLRLAPEMRLTEGSAATWPATDQADLDRAMTETWIPRLRSGSGTNDAWQALGWTRAPDRFVEAQWARWGAELVRAMAATGGWAANLRVPVVTRERLVLGLASPDGEVLPPTLAGWQRFLELAPTSGAKFSALDDVGRWWFGRSIPRTLLSAGRDEVPASSGVPRSGAPASRSAVHAGVAA